MARAVTNGSENDLKHVFPDVLSAVWAFEIVVPQPGSQDEIELSPAEADKKVEAFALDGADERFRESVCDGRFVRFYPELGYI